MSRPAFALTGAIALIAVTIASPHLAQAATAFEDGMADRGRWESFFAGQSGARHDGAYFWSGQRSLAAPQACTAAGATPEFVEGCRAAQALLAPFDARRRSEPDYRRGWNAWTAPPLAPVANSGINCKTIVQDAARLACYDADFGAPPRPHSAPARTIVTSPTPPAESPAKTAITEPAKPIEQPVAAPPGVSQWLANKHDELVGVGKLAMEAVECGRLPQNITRGFLANTFWSKADELTNEPDRKYASNAFMTGAAHAAMDVEDDRAAACGSIETDRMIDALDQLFSRKPIWPANR